MEKMILATGVLSDLATITGPTGLGDLGIDNLKRQSLQEPYRFSGGSAVIDVDFGQPVTLNVAALIGHTGGQNATCQVTAGATVGASTFDTTEKPFQSQVEASSTAPSFSHNLFFQLFAPQTYRYWRFTINDPDASYIDIGRLYLSKAFQPDYNMVYGMTQGFVDMSSEFVTQSGDSISLKRPKRRISEFNLEDLSEGESYGQLLVLDNLIGTTKDVLFVPRPDDKTYLQINAVYGKVSEIQPVAWTEWNRFTRNYKITELIP